MNKLRLKKWQDGWYPVNGDMIDTSFDTDGVFYSGFVPKPERKSRIKIPTPKQKPLTELEQKIRERWHANKDPVLALKLRGYYGKFI